jgi:hypothetical protein
MIVVNSIFWQPIANMPEDRKDGRQMLLWDEEGALVSEFSNGNWALDGMIVRPRFWADINPPEAS